MDRRDSPWVFLFLEEDAKDFGGRKVGENGDDDPHLTLLLLTALG